MQKDRLKWASDQCPLPNSTLRPLKHTKWYADAHGLPKHRLQHTDGYTQVIAQNKLVSWYRTFSESTPQLPTHNSWLTISEWIPRYQPGPTAWKRFGPNYTCAYAPLHPDYVQDWRWHAKRHLKAFKKSDCSLRLGSPAEVKQLFATSQVPKPLQVSLYAMLERHLAVHPETIDILIATKNDQPIACLVAGYCDEIKTSEYLIGAFHPNFKKDNPMVGLVNWWYERALARGHSWVSFGHMEPPDKLPLMSGNGYSFFKTHFGVIRVWFPAPHWQLRLNLKARIIAK